MQDKRPEPARISEHLANERTYLAWLRTSLSILTLGFATNRFATFLFELRMKSEGQLPNSLFGGPRSFGLGMVLVGTILIVTSAVHYQRTKSEIESGHFHPNTALMWTVTALSALIGLAATLLLLQAE